MIFRIQGQYYLKETPTMFNTLLFKLPQMYAMHGNRNSLTSCPEGMSEFVTTHLTLDHGSELFTVTALISLL